MNQKQEDLTSGLIMNLGIEFMKWKQENADKGHKRMQGKKLSALIRCRGEEAE